jgi:hypothetical protein
MFEINGDYVRVTGLRLRGPSGDKDSALPEVAGILAHANFVTLIDHNDMCNWTNAAIVVDSNGPNDHNDFTCQPPPRYRTAKVSVVRNFLHHNERQNLGYGVVIGANGYALIEGNVFLMNRHAIADDGTQMSGYSAFYNIVLSDAPDYGHYEQDFDMHGSDPSSHHTGGIAGSTVEISGNTFLGTNRLNFDLRGVPCPGAVDKFQNNITVRSESDAIRWYFPPLTLPSYLKVNGKFEATNPTQRLGVADFDGDGKDDLFLATGEAWYYAPAGMAEWRFLSANTRTIDQLLFGDFDGDGHADVFTQSGRDWLVSWGGISPWQKINESGWPMKDYVISDFVGDRRADVFFARGDQWFVSDGGVVPFAYYSTSGYKISDLRFGDFDGDGKTDIVGVIDNKWQVVYARQDHSWQPLRPKLTDNMNGLFVADFDGNGRADIARFVIRSINSIQWQVSRDGTGDWTPLSSMSPSAFAAIGRFDDQAGADILVWQGNVLYALSAGTGNPSRPSRQTMR